MTPDPVVVPEEPRPSARRSARRLALGIALSACIGWLVLAFQLFHSPPDPPLGSADAVVVLAGAASERLPVAEELIDRGIARELALSSTGLPGNAATDEVCRVASPEVTCFSPDPLTTRGEARAIAALAREQGWDTVIVVTSTYHVTRASVNISQCSRASVTMASSQPDLGPVQWLGRFVEESVALAASFARPACAQPV
ncbi:YdcF family protein [Arthrobacter echini]|uniref:YdcF family protein n=1 Tax=Arthrobacter echini TaxID=1529066 RepID=A0A4V3Z5M0_9MICC|nr:YdcF family protein [Arthrobacter echini]THJ66939.1 YdcF family protein [Arthrobacter echini]